jgi:hypothetical protein
MRLGLVHAGTHARLVRHDGLLPNLRVPRALRKYGAFVSAGAGGFHADPARINSDFGLSRAAERKPTTRHRKTAVATGGSHIRAHDTTSLDEQRPRSVTRDDQSDSFELNNDKSGRKDKVNSKSFRNQAFEKPGE